MRSKALLSSVTAVAVAVSLAAFAPTAARAATTWSTPTEINIGSGTSMTTSGAKLVMSSTGPLVHAVFVTVVSGQSSIKAVTSTDGGVTWSSATTLGTSTLSITQFDVSGSSDATKVVAVWSDPASSPASVKEAHTSNSGSTWSTAQALSSDGVSAEPDVVMSADGSHAYSVWVASTGPLQGARISESNDSGASWTASTLAPRLSPAGISVDFPHVATSSDGGKVAVTWLAYGITPGNAAQLAYSANSGTSWTLPTIADSVSPGAGQDVQVSFVGMDATGSHTIVMWEDDAGANTIQARTTPDGGTTWTGAPVIVDTGVFVASDSLSFVTSASSAVSVIGWQDNSGATQAVRVAGTSDYGSTWTVNRLNAAPTNISAPAMSVTPDGSLAQVVWRKGNPSGSVQTSTSTDGGGSWATESTLSGGAATADTPSIALSNDATWRVALYTQNSAAALMSTRTAPAPTVTVISPSSGYITGGTAITVTGTGFKSGASVKIGSSAATSVKVASGTSITAVAPAGAAGAVDVTVTNVDGQSGTMTGGFTYSPLKPQIPVKKLYVATKIKPKKWTKLVNVPVTLNSGLRGSPVVTATIPGKSVGAVSKKVFKTKRKSGYLWAYSSGRKRLSVLLSLSASPIGDYAAYSYSKTYKVKKAK